MHSDQQLSGRTWFGGLRDWGVVIALAVVLHACGLRAETSAFMRLQVVSRGADGGTTLRGDSETNRFSTNFFTLMGAADPAGPFIPISSAIQATQPFTSATDYTFSASARGFYRVRTTNHFTALTEPLAWEAYNAAGTAGLDTRGFVGGIFDGRYIYFSPYQDVTNHGNVLRFDTRGSGWSNAGSWRAHNAGNTLGGLSTRGYQGGAFDGRYVYFSPAINGAMLRLDTTSEFTNSSSWRAYDASLTDGLNTVGFQGAVFDGRFVYFVPHFNGSFNGVVLRYDSQADFTNSSSWRARDAGNTSGLITKGYSGGVFDGRYVYFVPVFDGTNTHGRVLRLDTQGGFTSMASWLAYDASNTTISNTTGFKGGVFDGRYIYFVPYQGNGRVLRYDSQGVFTNAASWLAYDANNTDGKPSNGFMGAAFDGRHVWFAPYFNTSQHGIVLRYDTQGGFTNGVSWHAYDASATGGLVAKGFQGAVFDGRHVYFVPYRSSSLFSGVVLRFDARLPRQIPGTTSGNSFF